MTVSHPAVSFSFLLLAGLMLRRFCPAYSIDTTTLPSTTTKTSTQDNFTNNSSTITALVTTNQSTAFSTSDYRNQTLAAALTVTNSTPHLRTIVPTVATPAITFTSAISAHSSQTTEYNTLNNATNGTALVSSTSTPQLSTRVKNATKEMVVSFSSSFDTKNKTFATKLQVSSTILVTTTKLVTPSSAEKPFPITENDTLKKSDSDNLPKALSSASVVAIVIGFIALVVLLGGAYHFKIRRPSYGRLLDDTEYRSGGNFLNPVFEG
ncbi:prostate androgen-regulated mucin-like protein 1 homolog isoform X1 [Electrophorus electricus]|nr:prostate androgen-regulated mucin-like protein 1 homolog isoform X1 [Electrophorus electricus]XP_035391574.1 prostate androgen-regulated mucin-like protein 1 homolog isoform X1 [Electrophorus electricus]